MANRIKGITIEIGGDTTKLQKAIQGVDKQLKTTQGALRDINKLLKFNPGNVELLTQKQKGLESAIKTTKTRLDELRKAQDGVEQGTAEWDALQREIIDTENYLKNLQREYANFGSVAAQRIADVGDKMSTLGKKISDVGAKLTRNVTLPLSLVGGAAVKSFAEVDKTMQLTNKTMGNTEEQAKLLSDAMKDAAANSTFGMDDAAAATLNFARAGLTAEQAAAALAPAMNLAAGEGGNLDTVSAGLTATINGFGGSFDEASKYADVFANACNNSALDVDSLASSMSTAAPIFSAAGYSVQDAALYMGVMANAGIEASEAANALKTGLSKMISPSKEGKEWLDKLGVSVTDESGAMKDTLTIQQDLNAAFAGLSESEQIAAASAIFGKNQMSKWLALINTAPGDVEKLNKALEQEGTTQEMAAAMMEGFGGSMEKLKSSIDVAKTSLGEALAPTISKVADVIQRAIDKFNSLTDEQKQLIAKIGLVVAAIGPALAIGGKLLGSAGKILTKVPKMVKLVKLLGAAIKVLTSSLGVWGIAIAAAIAAGVLIYKNWDKIKAFAQKLLASLKVVFEGIKTAIVNAWNAAKTATQTVMTNIGTAVTNAWNNVKTATTNAWNNVKTAISNAITNAKNSVKNVVDTIKSAASSAWDSIKSTATSTWNAIRDAITKPIETAKDKISAMVDKIKDIFNNLKNAIKLPKLKIETTKVGGVEVKYPSIVWNRRAMRNPLMLDGATIFGAMGGKLYGGGEAGREVLLSYDKLKQMVGGGQTTVNVVVNPSQGMDERALAKAVAHEIQLNLNSRRAVWAT